MAGRSGGPHGELAAADLDRYAGLKSTKGGSVARKPAPDEAEAEARAINTGPWEPMAGMVKRLCPRCRYFFASPAYSTEPRCANCVSLGTGRPRAHAPA